MPKIIVVEDNELILNMIRINLEKEGYSVTCCRDGETMMELIENEFFDALLLDIMLPGISGLEVLKKVKNLDLRIPVVMVTAKGDVNTKVQALNEGADDYLAKPFNTKELLARVNAVLRRAGVSE